MVHPLFRVCGFRILAPYTLRVTFDDGTEQVIDFAPVLVGELFGPLRDVTLFNRVQIDPEVHTLVWPNGADFDPATLHDWPAHVGALAERAPTWKSTESEAGHVRDWLAASATALQEVWGDDQDAIYDQR